MEDLKDILQLPMKEINEKISSFVHSADGFENNIKLYFALLTLMRESMELMNTIDVNDFIEKVRLLLQNINEENVKLNEEYHTQIFQDNEIATVLADNGAGRLLEVQKRVTESLDEYERLMKSIVMTRDQLPLEKQMEQEKHV